MEIYNSETVLQYVGKNYINLNKRSIQKTNKFLEKVLHAVIGAMRNENQLFRSMFEAPLFAGSSYDGLKVGKPDEYDIDLKLCLPRIIDIVVQPSNKDGFVYLYLKDWDRFKKDNKLYSKYRGLEYLKNDDNYLSQEKIKQWMEGIVKKAIDNIKEKKVFNNIDIKVTKSGPAMTLIVEHQNDSISIDLVVVFRMPSKKYPKLPIRPNFSRKKANFLVVPKPPKILDVTDVSSRYWRLSLPYQERQIMNNLNCCKPVLRFIKQLRDKYHPNIPSYFIKTIFLLKIEETKENGDLLFWKQSLTDVFLNMLNVYRNYIRSKDIPYFWNRNNNLLLLANNANITNITRFLDSMIINIHENIRTDPVILAKYLLPEDEYFEVCNYFQVEAI